MPDIVTTARFTVEEANRQIQAYKRELQGIEQTAVQVNKRLSGFGDDLRGLEQSAEEIRKLRQELAQLQALESRDSSQQARIKELQRIIALRQKEFNLQNQFVTRSIANARKQARLHQEERKRVEQQIRDLQAVDKQREATNRNGSRSTRNLTNDLVRHIRRVETLIVSLFGLAAAYRATVGRGIELNKTVESISFGLAGLISANTRYTGNLKDANAEQVRFQAALALSRDTLLEIKRASVETAATFPELTQIVQQALGFSLQAGTGFAPNVNTAIERTIEISQSLSNLGSAVGQTSELVLEEIRSIFAMDVTRDSKLGILLFGSPSEANRALKDAVGNVDGLYRLLRERLKSFDPLLNIDTFQRNFEKAKAEFDNILMEATTPLFGDLTQAFKDVRDFLRDNGDDIVTDLQDWYDILKDIGAALDEIIVGLAGLFVAFRALPLATRGVSRLVDALVSVDTRSANATKGITRLTTAVRGLARANAGLIAVGAVAGIAAFSSARDEAQVSDVTRNLAESLRGRREGAQDLESRQQLLQVLEKELEVRRLAVRRTRETDGASEVRLRTQESIVSVYEKEIAALKLVSNLTNDQIEENAKNEAELQNQLKARLSITGFAENQIALEKELLEAQIASSTEFDRRRISARARFTAKIKEIDQLRVVNTETLNGEELKQAEQHNNALARRRLLAQQTLNAELNNIQKRETEQRQREIERQQDRENQLRRQFLGARRGISPVEEVNQRFARGGAALTALGTLTDEDWELFQQRYQEELDRANEREARASNKARDVRLEDLKTYEEAVMFVNQEIEKSFLSSNQRIANVLLTLNQSLKSGFADFFNFTSEGFLDLENLARNVLNSILSQVIQQNIASPLAGALTAGVGAIFSGISGGASAEIGGVSTAGSFRQATQGLQTGGIVGSSDGIIQGGSGIRDDLFVGTVNGRRVMLRGGEGILNQAATRSLGRETINEINRSGRLPQQRESQKPVNIVMNINNQTGQDVKIDDLSAVIGEDERGEMQIWIEGFMNATENNMTVRDRIKQISRAG